MPDALPRWVEAWPPASGSRPVGRPLGRWLRVRQPVPTGVWASRLNGDSATPRTGMTSQAYPGCPLQDVRGRGALGRQLCRFSPGGRRWGQRPGLGPGSLPVIQFGRLGCYGFFLQRLTSYLCDDHNDPARLPGPGGWLASMTAATAASDRRRPSLGAWGPGLGLQTDGPYRGAAAGEEDGMARSATACERRLPLRTASASGAGGQTHPGAAWGLGSGSASIPPMLTVGPCMTPPRRHLLRQPMLLLRGLRGGCPARKGFFRF